MISVKHLSKRYGDFVAVDNVSFSIGQGEVVGLLGHNGAGKTTIMKMLTGFLEPSSGEVELYGHALSTHAALAQADIGYLPENLPVYPELSIIDYLNYCANMHGYSGKLREQRVLDALDKTRLTHRAQDIIHTLSRGYKQRVGVAQALLHSPKLLILDEPTNGLDPEQTQHMRELIRALSKESTIILSTHILQEVEASCDRVLIMDTGKLVLDKKLTDVTQVQGLRVRTDAPESVLHESLPDGSGITLHPSADTMRDMDITLPSSSETEPAAISLSTAISRSGHTLAYLERKHSNLESIFNAVHQTRGEQQ